MTYSFKVKAEDGWFVALTKREGQLHLAPIKYWGATLHPTAVPNFTPLDEQQESYYTKKNCIGVVDPNETYPKDHWVKAARLKAIELGWLSD